VVAVSLKKKKTEKTKWDEPNGCGEEDREAFFPCLWKAASFDWKQMRLMMEGRDNLLLKVNCPFDKSLDVY